MMSASKSYDQIPLYGLVFLTALFCAFAIGYEKYSADQAQARLEKHALIVADALWNFNTAGVIEYLHLAAEADHYASLEIVNHNGEVFQTVYTGLPSALEQMLMRTRLVSQVVLVAPVWSSTNIIGWIKAVWVPLTLSVHISVLAFLFMVQLVLVLYCKILKEKQLLEQRVNRRTFELSEANTSLKREIYERGLAEKAREELQQSLLRSKKMESLGLLAGGVAHDLNNVLSGIVSYPDLLLHDMPVDSPMRKIITTIRDSGLRAAEIVQDLLSLARRGVVARKLLNLNKLIDEYCNSPEHQKLLGEPGSIEVTFDLEHSLANILGSQVGLKKLLMNLVANGVEAQPDGGQVIITTKNMSISKPLEGFQVVPPGEYVVLSVSDKGEGISEKDQQQIFEPFYTKKVMGRSGTGLGLTVVWGTVEDHNGAIGIDSTLGQGTTITVYLPVCHDEPQTTLLETQPHAELQGNGETVLVIDDIGHQREIACAILKRLNYKPAAVKSGEEAITFLRTTKIDLMVLDMIMDGGLDGLETYRKALEFDPGQKAIIVSGFSETDRVIETQRLGAGTCIKKPYKLEELGMAVKQELQGKSSIG
ncbi:MAG: response regulator [Proteobacteria bacterium]|nr:response regulator [Pseudomonadota bacterium]